MYTNEYYISRIVDEYEYFFIENRESLNLNMFDIADLILEISNILKSLNFMDKAIVAKGKICKAKEDNFKIDKFYKNKLNRILKYEENLIEVSINEKREYTRETYNNPDLIILVSIYNKNVNDSSLTLIYNNL